MARDIEELLKQLSIGSPAKMEEEEVPTEIGMIPQSSEERQRYLTTTPEEAIKKLMAKEGFSSSVYDDAYPKKALSQELLKSGYKFRGKPTIGFGTVISPEELASEKLKSGHSIYDLDAQTGLELARSSNTLQDVARQIAKLKEPITNDQLNSLYEAGYNIGPTSLSKIIDTINEKGYKAGADQLDTYVYRTENRGTPQERKIKDPGLIKRRKEESNRLRGKQDGAVIDSSQMPKLPQEELLNDLLKTRESGTRQPATAPEAPLIQKQVMPDQSNQALEAARKRDMYMNLIQNLDTALSRMSAATPNVKSPIVESGIKYKTNTAEDVLKQLKESRSKAIKVGDQIVELNPQTGKYEAVYQAPASSKATRRLPVTIANPETGKPEVYLLDPITGEKELVGAKTYSPILTEDPYTKEKLILDRITGKMEVMGAKPQQFDKEEVRFYETLNPKQRETLDSIQSSFNNDTQKARESFSQITSVSDELVNQAIGNPITASQLGAIVANIFENGRLTDEDVKRYTRRRGIFNQIEDTLKEATQGTITEEKASAIRKALKDYTVVLEDAIKNAANYYGNQYSKRYGSKDQVHQFLMPDEYISQVRKSKPETESISDKVNVILPDGRKGKINRDRLDAFKQKYPNAQIME